LAGHRDYFVGHGQFAEKLLLYCARFRLIEHIAE